MQQSELNFEGIEKKPLAEFTENAYLHYSMYVILDRALPYIGDGLKPVQRRIIYAMSELGLKSTAKFKKSARTVGDVLGKFHPHGDSACYEAMVLMAQDFSYRYPLVDGQGNWGSPDDPKSFAAMRYTEARLAPYADLLLGELGQGTIDWQANFDGTLDEPKLLPARLPNVLLNGTMGIAVGMSTDIPPHNLCEVANACVHLLDYPKATLDEICDIVPAPDYPTGAEIITSKEDIKAIYQRGNGSLRLRAVYHKEQSDIIITALPYQVSGAKILEQIAQQMQAKKLPMVADLRDESDHENPTRLVIVPRSNRIDSDEMMNHLFATTDLEKSYRVNLNMVGLDQKPRVKNLLLILTEWLHFRRDVVRRRLQHRLEKILARLHVLDALLIAFLNIDEVINIIREEDHPKAVLMTRFQLTDIQAEAILDLKLRHLAKLEEQKITAEQNELATERDGLEKTLSSEQRMTTLIKKEILADAEKYGDPRKSILVTREEARALKAENILPSEAVTVILSTKGWVRAAKGHDIDVNNLSYKAGDRYLASVSSQSNQQAVFFDSSGRSYSLSNHSLPSARGQGEPLTGRLNPPAGEQFISVIDGGDPKAQFLLASDAGYGFIVTLADLVTKNRNGKAILKLPTNAKMLTPQLITDLENSHIAAVTNEGRLLVFPTRELPLLGRGKGNKIINVPTDRASRRKEWMVGIAVVGERDELLIHAGRRHTGLKAKDLAHYLSSRGRRGNKLPRGLQKVDKVTVK